MLNVSSTLAANGTVLLASVWNRLLHAISVVCISDIHLGREDRKQSVVNVLRGRKPQIPTSFLTPVSQVK